MSAETEASDSSVPLAGVAGADGDRTAGAPSAAGRLLGRPTVLPALLAMAWLLTGLPLLMLGWFTLAADAGAVRAGGGRQLVIFGLRWIPGRWPARAGQRPGRAARHGGRWPG